MRKTLLFGVGVGAVLMYYCDPSWGRRRRAQLRGRMDRSVAKLEAWRERVEAERSDARADGRARDDDPDIDWMEGDTYRSSLIRVEQT